MSGTNLSVATMRQRVAAHLVATLSGWAESGWLYDQWPDALPAGGLHKQFALGVGDTTFDELDRQKSGGTSYVHTTLTVRWGYALQNGGEVASFDAALAEEAAIFAAIRSCVGSAGPSVTIESATRSLQGESTWVMGDITCISHHSVTT